MQEPTIFDPIKIDSGFIKIRPLSATTWEKLADGILYEDSFHAKNWGIKTREDVQKMYENSIKGGELKKGNPIVFLSEDENEVLGVTNFVMPEPHFKKVEIGGTWISKKWQRTHVNTLTKYELLKYCFEVLRLNRVEFMVDQDNLISQKAVGRLGVNFEGIQYRRKINANKEIRDYYTYAVTDLTWPKVKAQIESLIKLQSDPVENEISRIKKLQSSGNSERAFEETLNLIKQNPKHPGLQYLAGRICDASRTEKEAVPFYLNAIEFGLKGNDLKELYLCLASTYRSLGEYKKSKEIFEKGLREFPEYRPYKVFLAMTEFNLGNSEAAVSLLLKELVSTTNDQDIRSYKRPLEFYSDRLTEIFD